MPRSVADHPSVVRVRTYLADHGAADRISVLADSTRTAVEAAQTLGVEVGQIASSLLFYVDGEPVLVVASGAQRVNTTKLAQAMSAQAVRKPDAQEVKAATGFAIGGVAPVAHSTQVTVLVDRSLAQFDEVWAAAGHPFAVFATSYSELLNLTGGRPADVQGP